MIYLLSQMVFALVLAVLLGAALGWILHRNTKDKDTSKFKNVINRQRQQYSQLQSEIAMLTDDYDELQRQSHDELIELREANQQIPSLSTNLEKSQLLVSQMLKKHDSQLRELNTQNQSLATRLKNAESHEQAYYKQQADLDSERRNQDSSSIEIIVATAAMLVEDDDNLDDTVLWEQPASAPTASASTAPTPDTRTQPVISSARNTGSWASAPVTINADREDEQEAADANSSASDDSLDASEAVAVLDETSSIDEEDLDAVHVVIDEDIWGIDDDESVSEDLDLTAAVGYFSDDESDEESGDHDNSLAFTQVIDNSPVIFLNADTPESDSKSDSRNAAAASNGVAAAAPAGETHRSTSAADASETVSTEQQLELPELPELPADVFDVDPFDQVIEIGDDLQLGLDDTSDEEESNSFDPVEHRDDLQQIFGIDHLTEIALNDLGITSFAQLAKLKHHEIETIANALKIVPERIERDDWVGNARSQLEDVLEDL
ncbi:hypothetical protein [Granulosicoccus antarcticus]|uniref:50S ribosomal protein L21 n=1 Tax=Granulosicoccus antarcticus IMCC3135 TaxID=1192854 RepID=A0A2Z2NTT3_9GAMM|nr:hypothetical protein [Granulosicoccus antarcticus]ASJ74683.1 hypothetical protein IMCC3135_23070 [Granulosicoccus antarcticus IMCC3135]